MLQQSVDHFPPALRLLEKRRELADADQSLREHREVSFRQAALVSSRLGWQAWQFRAGHRHGTPGEPWFPQLPKEIQ